MRQITSWGLRLFLLLCLLPAYAAPPILILLNESSPQPNYCNYIAEILKTEGISEFETAPLSNLDRIILTNYSIIILPQTHDDNDINLLADSHLSALRAYASSGNLVAFRPDTRIADLFGVKWVSPQANDSRLRVSTSTRIGKSITPKDLNIHGHCDGYELDSRGVKIAAYAPGGATAIASRDHAIAFGYNLPANLVATRQGNPAKANFDWDQDQEITAQDMFVDDWNDPQNNAINQADEQMRLLTHAIEYFMDSILPLPRAWYFKNQLKSTVIFTSDGEDSTYADELSEVNDVLAAGGTMTLYIKNVSQLTADDAESIRNNILAKGCEISIHPNDVTHAREVTYASMSNAIGSKLGYLNKLLNIPTVQTIRNHWILWSSLNPDQTTNYLSQVNIESLFDVKMDCNYYFYDRASPLGPYLGGPGSFIGSGLIM